MKSNINFNLADILKLINNALFPAVALQMLHFENNMCGASLSYYNEMIRCTIHSIMVISLHYYIHYLTLL